MNPGHGTRRIAENGPEGATAAATGVVANVPLKARQSSSPRGLRSEEIAQKTLITPHKAKTQVNRTMPKMGGGIAPGSSPPRTWLGR